MKLGNPVENARKSVASRGLPYYYGLNKQYPRHWNSFINMHKRTNDTDFPRTYEGFKSFVEYLGPVPEGMSKPTIGRKDHSIGYRRGNFEWQSQSDNCRDAGLRSCNILKTTFRGNTKFRIRVEYYKANPENLSVDDIISRFNADRRYAEVSYHRIRSYLGIGKSG